MVICHALTGSSDVEDWCASLLLVDPLSHLLTSLRTHRWGPLLGPSHAFDPTRYFIFCANVMGSPYGTASPVTKNPDRDDGGWWGPEFPLTTVRDDVRCASVLSRSSLSPLT